MLLLLTSPEKALKIELYKTTNLTILVVLKTDQGLLHFDLIVEYSYIIIIFIFSRNLH